MNNSVVITGMGIVSAIGNDKNQVLDSLKKNVSGIGRMKYLSSQLNHLPVGEVKLSNEQMEQMLGLKHDPYLSRTTLMGILAVRQALMDAGVYLVQDHQCEYKIALVSGTTVGGMDVTEKYFKTLPSSDEHVLCLKHHDCGACTQDIVDYFHIFSCATTISTACSSAANALMVGAEMIKNKEADIVVAGGTEALSMFHLNGFNALMILDSEQCKPFDRQRVGLNLGEGAAFMVLESQQLALQRKAQIDAYLTGCGNACDAFHQTATSPDADGPYLAMSKALQQARLTPQQIQYVNAHGTGTPNNDATESIAIKRLFKQDVPPVSSTKSFTGHTTSASGAIEAVISVLALKHQFVPANIGFKNPMEDGIVPSMGVGHCKIENVLCNSFGFGGNDTSLIFSQNDINVDGGNEIKVKAKKLAEVEISSDDCLDEIKKYVKPMDVRRMGKIIKSSLLSSLKALEKAGVEKPDAIITATDLGCLDNSEKILFQMCQEGEQAVKPTLFMQSTHNTIGSNIAIYTGCKGYNITYTHGERSLEWAMKDAQRLIETGACKTVLVGLHQETTTLYREKMRMLGMNDLKPLYSLAIVMGKDK